MTESIASGRFAIIIPVYNHEECVADVVRRSLALGMPVIVVDDGSTDRTAANIEGIKGVMVLHHTVNRGKGAAIKTGFAAAARFADWAITIDGDGQHDPADALRLIDAIPAGERPIVIGMRADMLGDDVPWTSRFGRGFSNFWVRASGGPRARDTQSGFRIYPLPEALELGARADRYQFEVEIMARAGWRGMAAVEAPISVTYSPGSGRVSHFMPFRDFMRNSAVFSRLIFQRIMVPRFIRRRWVTQRRPA